MTTLRDIATENEEAAKEVRLAVEGSEVMIDVDLPAISRDVADRLRRETVVKVRVLDEKTTASDVTVYVFVDVIDGGGKNSLDILDMFEAVEEETSKRFNVDVLVVPEPPEYV